MSNLLHSGFCFSKFHIYCNMEGKYMYTVPIIMMCTCAHQFLLYYIWLWFHKKTSSFCLLKFNLNFWKNSNIWVYLCIGRGQLSIGTCAWSHYDLCICTIKMCSNQVMHVINHNRIHLPRQYMLDHDIDMKKYPLM